MEAVARILRISGGPIFAETRYAAIVAEYSSIGSSRYNQKSDQARNAMKIERWGWYSIAVNVLLALLHGLIVFSSESLAVAAELAHNIIDMAATVALLIGLKLAGRKSKSFPYGLYKWLVSQKVDVVFTREDVSRKGPAYVLREAGVELRMTDRETIGEVILSAA
jgi:hypothetical protein